MMTSAQHPSAHNPVAITTRGWPRWVTGWTSTSCERREVLNLTKHHWDIRLRSVCSGRRKQGEAQSTNHDAEVFCHMKLWFCVLLKSACFSITWGVTTAKRAHKPTGLIKTVTLRYRRCVVSCFQRRVLRWPLLTARKLDSGYVTWICSVQTPETRWKLNTVEFKPRQILSAWVIPSETLLSCFIIQEIVFKWAAIVVQLEITTAHHDASLRNICIRNMWTSAEELNVQQSDTQETLQVRRVRLPVSREDLILDVWDGACLNMKHL